MTYDNAASRLLTLLNNAKNIDKNVSSITAWRTLLNSNDPAIFLSRMGKVIELPEQISNTLSNSIGMNAEILNHISNQFHLAFVTQCFNEKWSEFIDRIDSHVLNYLSLASTLLETNIKTKKLSDDELNQLRTNFSELLDQVRESNLSSRIKSYIINQLHMLLLMLDEYFITGAEPVLERMESIIGHAYVDTEYKNFLTDHELGKSLLNCLGAAANLVTVAVGLPQLTQIIQLIQQGN